MYNVYERRTISARSTRLGCPIPDGARHPYNPAIRKTWLSVGPWTGKAPYKTSSTVSLGSFLTERMSLPRGGLVAVSALPQFKRHLYHAILTSGALGAGLTMVLFCPFVIGLSFITLAGPALVSSPTCNTTERLGTARFYHTTPEWRRVPAWCRSAVDLLHKS